MNKEEIVSKLDALFATTQLSPYKKGDLKKLTKQIKQMLGVYCFQVVYRQGSMDDFGCGWTAYIDYWSDDESFGDRYEHYMD